MEKEPEQLSAIYENVQKEILEAESARVRQRFQHNLALLEGGGVNVLLGDEFVNGLVLHLKQKHQNDWDYAKKLLHGIGKAVCSSESRIRERAVTIFSMVTGHFLETRRTEELLIITSYLCDWLSCEKIPFSGFPVIMKKLEQCSVWLLEKGRFQDVYKVLSILSEIIGGNNDKPKILKNYAAAALNDLSVERNLQLVADRYLHLKLLADRYLGVNEALELYHSMLLIFGTRAAGYLFRRMSDSQSRQERLDILAMLITFGQDILPVIAGSLEKQPHWTIARNAIRICSELGDDNVYPIIRGFYQHEDSRVQYETIRCVVKLGGNELIARLVDAIPLVNDTLKAHVLNTLIEQQAGDQILADAIRSIIDRKNMDSEEIALALFRAIMETLKKTPSHGTINILESLSRCQVSGLPQKNKNIQIAEALRLLYPRLRHPEHRAKDTAISTPSDLLEKKKAIGKWQEIEPVVHGVLGQGDSASAGKIIYDQALNAAMSGEFRAAELMRDKLLEVDPMAFADVLQLDEIIDEQKNKLIFGYEKGVQKQLSTYLSAVEYELLCSILHPAVFAKGTVIVSAGDSDHTLYLVNSGAVGVYCKVGGNEYFVKKVGAGSVLGGDQFFSASVWTITLKAISDVNMLVMDQQGFYKLNASYPELGYRMQEFCKNNDKITALLQMSGADRREYPRYSIALDMQNALIDSYGRKKNKFFRGRLIDISRSGLSFKVKVSSQETARMMLGMQLVAVVQAGTQTVTLGEGRIVGVRAMESDAEVFSVHIKLNEDLEEMMFRRLLVMS